jgi:hypothetical protein
MKVVKVELNNEQMAKALGIDGVPELMIARIEQRDNIFNIYITSPKFPNSSDSAPAQPMTLDQVKAFSKSILRGKRDA